MFGEEDRLSSKMKMRMREYNEKVDKCLLPHLGEILQVLNVEADRMSGDENVSESDMALLQTQIKEVKQQMDTEKKTMGSCMQDIYDSWKEIKALRKQNGYQATALDLGVQEYTS